jgi:arylsulfatase
LDVCTIPAPTEVNGIKQKPMEGISMAYTFENAEAPDQRTTQYFEMMTTRAIYHDGWIACNRPILPWETGGRTLKSLKTTPWELYNIENDFSEADNLASKEPARLKEMQDLFLVEAKKHNVLPLDPRLAERLDPKLRDAGDPPTSWTYFGNRVSLPEPIGPQLFPRALEMVADIEIPDSGAEGVIACAGAFSAGWSLYVIDGKPVFHYNVFDLATTTISGDQALPKGSASLKVVFTPEGTSVGSGMIELFVDDQSAGTGKLARTVFRHGLEPFEIGRDSITPVDPAYAQRGEFEFTGAIKKIKFDLK